MDQQALILFIFQGRDGVSYGGLYGLVADGEESDDPGDSSSQEKSDKTDA